MHVGAMLDARTCDEQWTYVRQTMHVRAFLDEVNFVAR